MRWCFLGSHEIPDGERMVMARGGSHICVPCSETPTGKAQLVDTLGTEGYRQNHSGKHRLNRALAHWMKKGVRG